MATTKMTKWENPFSSIPHEFIQPSPWSIHSRKDRLTGYAKPFMQTCGNKKLIVSGHLNMKDKDTSIGLTILSAKHECLDFESSVNELVRILGTQYTPQCKNSIRKSLFRLQRAKIQIIIYDESGKVKRRIAHNIVTSVDYINNEKGTFRVCLDPYFYNFWNWKEVTHFDLKFLMTGIRTDIAKQLYLFYQKQTSQMERKGYKIGLEKLCNYIGLDRNNKQPLSTKRFQIKKAHEELIKTGYLKSFTLKSNDVLRVSFNKEFGKRQERAEEEEEQYYKIRRTPDSEFRYDGLRKKYPLSALRTPEKDLIR